ncbi:hypothetical protein C8R45DRAFT_1133224 [Mycena sanguinolenta]|nr:hypothetical protein C8R45DRAFT_1133224 [Mycena sanguinolenta]
MDHEDSPEIRVCVDDSMVHPLAAAYNSQFADRALSSTPDPRPFSPLPTTPPLPCIPPPRPRLRLSFVSFPSSRHLLIHRPQLESYSTSPLPVCFLNWRRRHLKLCGRRRVFVLQFCGKLAVLAYRCDAWDEIALWMLRNGRPAANPFPPPSRPFAFLIVNAALIAFRVGPSSQLAPLSTSVLPSLPPPILVGYLRLSSSIVSAHSPHITGRPSSNSSP